MYLPSTPLLRRRFQSALLTLGLALVAGNMLAQQELKVHGPFVAKKSGTTFPEQAGVFQRVAITLYSPDEKNISVGYNLADLASPVAVTVYIYPARSLISIGSPREVVEGARRKLEQMEMDSVIHEILNAHRGAKIIVQATSSITTGGRTIRSLHARFAYEEVFASKKQPLLSEAWLFTTGKWYVKYRVTYPVGNGASTLNSVKKLMASLPIPGG